MKMKKAIYLCLLVMLWQACSVEDEGNYDYMPLNGVSITFDKEEENQVKEKGVDVLKINPTVEGDVYGENEENYEYTWFFCSGQDHKHTIVGHDKNLEWPVSFKPGKYTLYFQVVDKSTGLEWLKSTGVTVFSDLTQGWLLLGENADEELRLDILARKASGDLVVIEDIFDNSEMHLKNPYGLIFTGSRQLTYPAHLWMMTDDNGYKLTWGNKFELVGESYETMIVEQGDVSLENPVIRDMFPRQYGSTSNSCRNNSNRGIITQDAIFMTVISPADQSEVYVTPINRYSSTSNEYFTPYPMAFVLLGARTYGNIYPLFYDMDAECFVQPNAVYGQSAQYCKTLLDYSGDRFSWDQKKENRTLIYGENLCNSTIDYICLCAALLKDKTEENPDYHIYTFQPGGKGYFGSMLSAPVKKGYFKEVATDFDKASHYCFMSRGNVLLYSVGPVVYAYDYSYNRITSFTLDAEITCLEADVIFNTYTFWAATYNEGTGKGTLNHVTLSGTSQPELSYEPEEDSFPISLKVKDIEWKYGDDPAEEEPEDE